MLWTGWWGRHRLNECTLQDEGIMMERNWVPQERDEGLLTWFSRVALSRMMVLKQQPRPATFAPPGSLLEMQIFRPHPRPNELKTLRVGLTVCVLTRSPGDSDPLSGSRTTDTGHQPPGMVKTLEASLAYPSPRDGFRLLKVRGSRLAEQSCWLLAPFQ